MEHFPFMASGKIVNSYELLYKYYSACREVESTECGPIPSSEDLKELELLVRRQETTNLIALIDHFSKKYLDKIRETSAKAACRSLFGRDMDITYCRSKIAELIASWLIEVADNLGIISLKYAWREGARSFE
ncbi:MAG: hypothetical protein ACO2OS_06290 [Thermosphaera aggregans]|uniref:hypothetical protein n=1 Tax=Thermosphaera aggregans TaxID=54254 RepID=UPI003C01F922